MTQTSAVLDTDLDEKQLLYRGQVVQIQRRLAALLPKYLLLDDWAKRIKSGEHLTDELRHQVLQCQPA